MRLFYQLGIRIFYLAVKLRARRNPKAKKWIEGRKGLIGHIEQTTKNISGSYWVHCASLGEFEQARPLIEAIKEQKPEEIIVLTFFSPSGYEVQKNYKLADHVFYLPLDTRGNAKRMIKALKPKAVFFIKYEFWYNLLWALNKSKTPIYFVSAIFRRDQLFFKWYGKWYRKLPALATHLFVQDEHSVELLREIGIKNVTITGDTRFDRVSRIVKMARPIPFVEKFLNGQKALILGSSWKAEEAMTLQYIRQRPDLKVIIAPHEVNQENISRIEALYGDRCILYSKVAKHAPSKKQVLIVDCYGLLTSIYQYGLIALIGGGFGAGIHNILEAATYGMPIIFGPKFQRFKEANDLVERKCAYAVNNIEDFNTILNQLIINQNLRDMLSKKSADYVIENTGATQTILKHIF
jgi:3-deoxy-D-manno-octulosonic-acid transferase